MKVLLTDYPKDADILRCKNRALRTVMGSKESTVMPTESWLHRICDAEHSPIRTMEYRFTLLDVPYWVSNELCRHHIGIEKFVSSQRNDRQKSYDRNSARQDAPVNIDIDINTEALMTLAHKRLCRKATNEMQ